MNVLMVHNRYTRPGGEDVVFDAERALLRRRGNEVATYEDDNGRIAGMARLALMATAVWSRHATRGLAAAIEAQRPRVAHFHNTFPLISPAAYRACRRRGVAVVQTLHNYRLVCPGGLLLREGRTCERCVGHAVAWSGIRHGCYHGSRTDTGAAAAVVAVHRLIRTWQTSVDVYVALTASAVDTFVRGGLPREKIAVKPNFVDPDPGVGLGDGGYALFVGRLSQEKGIGTLLEAWSRLGGRVPLKIVGDGPLATEVAGFAERHGAVQWLGWREKSEVLALMKEAAVLVVPSICREGFPLAVIEAYATGLPVVASDLGSLREIVAADVTGWTFEAGNAEQLAGRVAALLAGGSPLAGMRRAARAEYLAKYTAERNYEQLMEIYDRASGRLP